MDNVAATTQPTDDPFAARRDATNEIQEFEKRIEQKFSLAWDMYFAKRDELKKTDPERFRKDRLPGYLRRDLEILEKTTLGELRFLNQLVSKLAARIEALEARRAVKYCGVYEKGDLYRPGEFVTHGGSLWHCWAMTGDVPGSSDNWQLAVKRGKDARG